MRFDRGVAEIFTVGHGTRTLGELLEVLKNAEIDLLVDVRRFPGSRRHPHFARESLAATLPEAGVDYEWRGEAMGGRRNPVPETPNVVWRVKAFRGYADHMFTEEFQSALKELEERAASTRQAVMCSETLWWRCHRRLISDALVADGHQVTHLGMGRVDSHKLNEAARRTDDGLLIYDVGVNAVLNLDAVEAETDT